MKNFKTVGDYFLLNRPFAIPYYQRGYKWSIQRTEDKKHTHLDILLNDLLEQFNKGEKEEYYLQGVTVKERDNCIELVDGQQRTTSLFILLCALQKSGVALIYQEQQIELTGKLKYNVREKANEVIQAFVEGRNKIDDSIQDVAALNKAFTNALIFVEALSEKKEAFFYFLTCRVKLIYINLSVQQSELDTFSMMNQDKALMSKTDLIKSNLLREASRQAFSEHSLRDEGLEWQINHLRTKMAAEWDEWRKWWQNPEHFEFVGRMKVKKEKDVDEPNMSGLLALYYALRKQEKRVISQNELFEQYKSIIADKQEDKIEAIQVFEGLRKVQKSLEEWYDDYQVFNFYNLLFVGTNTSASLEDLVELLKEYGENKIGFSKHLKKQYIRKIIKLTPEDEQIVEAAKQRFIDDFNVAKDVYNDSEYYYQFAQQLLRMNVSRANRQRLKFDFSLYVASYKEDTGRDSINKQMRSLEHIAPQSTGIKEYSAPEETIDAVSRIISALNENSNGTLAEVKEAVRTAFAAKQDNGELLHSIGNFVLLPKGLNSSLSDRTFEDKKKVLFERMIYQSRHNYGLWLHTLEVFGKNSRWGAIEVQKNKENFIKELTKFFND